MGIHAVLELASRDGFSFALYIAASWAAFVIARFFYRGYCLRMGIRKLKAQGIPIAPHSFLFGHLGIAAAFAKDNPPDVNISAFQHWLYRNADRLFPDLASHESANGSPLPPVVYLDLWPVNPLYHSLALVTDIPTAVQHTQMQSQPKGYMSSSYMRPLTGGKDMVSSDGEEWKKWRSAFNPGFSHRNIMSMIPDLVEEMEVFVEGLAARAGPDGQYGSIFGMFNYAMNLTFDVIVRATLNIRLHEQTREQPSLLKSSLVEVLDIMSASMTSVQSAWPVFLKPWSIYKTWKNNKNMRSIIWPAVEAHRQADAKKTILGLALKSVTQKTGGGELDKRAVENILANTKVFLFAGHDTTATSISFMFKLLQDYPECMAKLRREHEEVLGPDPKEASKVLRESPHLLSSLVYTQAVTKETLRLYPVAQTSRLGSAGFAFDIPGASFPWPGADFAICNGIFLMHRDPRYWPRADEFVPERWLAEPGDPLCPVKNGFRGFELGPRNCVGQDLAVTEIKLAAAFACRQFDLVEDWDEWDRQRPAGSPKPTVDGQRAYMSTNGVGHPKDGMPMRVRKR